MQYRKRTTFSLKSSLPLLAGLLTAFPVHSAPGAGYYPPGYAPPPAMPVTQQGSTQPTYPANPYYPPTRFRPPPQQQYSGTPPTSYSRQFSYSYHSSSKPQPYQPKPPAMTPPSVEAILSERRPMVQQNLIYRVRINSEGNLKEAAPQPPQSDSVVFRQLGEPANYSASGTSGHKLVTEYTYLLIPLREGEIFLPGVNVTGKYNNGSSFNVVAEHGNALYVQPAQPGVQPWLPLYDLRIDAHLPDSTRVKAGEPVEIEIVTSAVGAVGTQLPSIASQLQSDDFYIYPGEVTTSGKISADGLDLLGSKIEKFTLVPRYGGNLNLPALSLQWWNLRSGKAATALLPVKQFQVQGSPNSNDERKDSFFSLPEGNSLLFWVPLVLVLLLMLGGWLKMLFGSGRNPVGGWMANRLRQVLGEAYQPLAALGRRLSPRRHFHRLRTWIGRQLPVSWKLWYCLRAVDKEDDPNTWGPALQILAAKHLGVRPNADLQTLGRSIATCHPAADPQKVAKLMAELDTAVYGGKTLASFAEWKAEFTRQIKPRLFPIRFRNCRKPSDKHLLPGLNPTIN
ncbi:BatD family protein [Thiolapillus sp.]